MYCKYAGKRQLAGITMVLMLAVPLNATAILQEPTQAQVEQAIIRGVDFAKKHRPPNELYGHFGSTKQFEPQGFLVTKMSGLAVMSSHFALRGERPTDQDIQRVLGEKMLQVIVTVFGRAPDFARESYLLMKQGTQVIKPDRIRVDAHAQAVGLVGERTMFRAKIVGFFSYGAFESESGAALLVFPGEGGESTFDLDLSTIP
ncbi:MAG: hypothetical protein OEY80_08575 [Nitrospirota bacterium]|nr:hypothetical protein [Nitrospirota bacterium]